MGMAWEMRKGGGGAEKQDPTEAPTFLEGTWGV